MRKLVIFTAFALLVGVAPSLAGNCYRAGPQQFCVGAVPGGFVRQFNRAGPPVGRPVAAGWAGPPVGRPVDPRNFRGNLNAELAGARFIDARRNARIVNEQIRWRNTVAARRAAVVNRYFVSRPMYRRVAAVPVMFTASTANVTYSVGAWTSLRRMLVNEAWNAVPRSSATLNVYLTGVGLLHLPIEYGKFPHAITVAVGSETYEVSSFVCVQGLGCVFLNEVDFGETMNGFAADPKVSGAALLRLADIAAWQGLAVPAYVQVAGPPME